MGEVISYNPANGEEIGRITITTPEEVEKLLAKAREAQAAWKDIGFDERAKYLLRSRQYLLDNVDEFARTITLDNGKSLFESLTLEIYPIADLIYYFAHNAKKMLKPFRQPIGILGALFRSSRIEYQPLGTIGIIAPWNYPFSIPAGEVAMALIAGNTVLLKPSSVTPMVGKIIAEMFNAADLPEGVFTHVPGDSSTGQALIEAGPDKILFTGSVGVGKKIMASCADKLTPLVLELGGKDPMVVREDADLEHASSGAVWGAFTNVGQTCAAVERLYVQESIYDKFVAAVVEKTKKLKVGNGLDPTVEVGAMTTESQLGVVEQQVTEAREKGAKIECGGARPEGLNGNFYTPTVITGVDHSFTIMRDETFGPVLPIMKFKDDEDAVKFANDSPYGLTASVWTKDIKTGQAMAKKIRAGTVMVNEAVYTHGLCQTPWGGVKDSGFGRSHSRFGLMELVEPHHIHTNSWCRKSMWWYPYSKKLYDRFKKLARTLTGGLVDKIKAMPSFLKIFLLKKR
jgi:succinate-semialdehyde dehydrogenase/glutarate-semialdehyde dehydrogenase